MPHIRFTVHADCDSQEPSRILPALQGEVFEFEGESDNEVRIGEIQLPVPKAPLFSWSAKTH